MDETDDKLDHSNTKSWARKPLFWLGVILFILGIIGLLTYQFFQVPPGRTSILVLGMAGGSYTGSDLTDTIIFSSIDHQAGRVLVLSLPRDIWITSLRTKLNSVYHYRGMEGAKEVVSEILGQPIDYGVLIDFEIFTKIVDFLGRVEVEVERSFDDYRYPIAGKENDDCGGDLEYKCRYEHLHFEEGLQTMDGEKALKYVRSRFAEGDEGTDFARNQRQQRLLLAIKNKILSFEFLSDPRRPVQLFKLVTANIKTDISQEEYVGFIKIAPRFRPQNLRTSVLNDELLINPSPSKKRYDNQWVLMPRGEDWREVQEYVAKLLDE